VPRKPQPRHTAAGRRPWAGALSSSRSRDGIRPPIWSRPVPEGLSLSGLHDVIQKVMGWTDSHLHDFHWREERFGLPDPSLTRSGWSMSAR
jgi:hypothetical protein